MTAAIHHALCVAAREQAGREASPTTAIIDSKTAKGAQKGALRSMRWAMMRAKRSSAARGRIEKLIALGVNEISIPLLDHYLTANKTQHDAALAQRKGVMPAGASLRHPNALEPTQ